MGRRTVGLLLVTGFVTAGVLHSEADRASAGALDEDAGFRTFASRGVTEAITPALRPGIEAARPESQQAAAAAPAPEPTPLARPAAESVQVSQAAPIPSNVPHANPPGAPPRAAAPASTAPPAAVSVTPPLAPAGPAAAGSAAAVPVAPTPAATGSWPKTLPEAKAEAEALANPQAVPQSWTQAEVELAKARCNAVLKGLDAVTIPEPAMRHGDCGTPAPVRLVSIGRNPEVALSPPPVLTCDMVAALHTWVKSDLQPLAKKHLGAAVIKIETMSDYSCRNAYGRTKSRLSEHGKANALDIRGFVTAKGEPAMLLADWGLTARDIAAQVAVAKAEAEKKAREKAAAEAAAIAVRAKDKGLPRAPGTSVGSAPGELAAQPSAAAPALGFRDGGATLSEGLPKVRLTIPGVVPDDDDDKPRRGPAFGVDPSRLGGPVPPRPASSQASDVSAARAEKETGKGGHASQPAASAPAVAPPSAPAASKGRTPITHAPASSRDQTSAKAKFLREAHASGCRIFGTILGPEANNAHRNHFHVDMAERKTTNFCE